MQFIFVPELYMKFVFRPCTLNKFVRTHEFHPFKKIKKKLKDEIHV